MHQIAEIKSYAAVVYGFCESEVVMEFLLLAFLVFFSVFFRFYQLNNAFPGRETFLALIYSIKLNSHGVIVDGVRGLYFSPIFRRRKRFWEE